MHSNLKSHATKSHHSCFVWPTVLVRIFPSCFTQLSHHNQVQHRLFLCQTSLQHCYSTSRHYISTYKIILFWTSLVCLQGCLLILQTGFLHLLARQTVSSYIPTYIDDWADIFVKDHSVRGPVVDPYNGAFHAFAHSLKTFTLDIDGRTQIVSVDCLQWAFDDVLVVSPFNPLQPPVHN